MFGDPFNNLLEIKRTKFYLDSFRFDIFIVRCIGGYFFRTQCILAIVNKKFRFSCRQTKTELSLQSINQSIFAVFTIGITKPRP